MVNPEEVPKIAKPVAEQVIVRFLSAEEFVKASLDPEAYIPTEEDLEHLAQQANKQSLPSQGASPS